MDELTEQEQLVIKAMRGGWDIDLTLNEKPESIQDELREIGLPYDFILEYFSGGSDGALGFAGKNGKHNQFMCNNCGNLQGVRK